MSLIQEALKRQQEESKGGKAAAKSSPPAEPAAAPAGVSLKLKPQGETPPPPPAAPASTPAAPATPPALATAKPAASPAPTTTPPTPPPASVIAAVGQKKADEPKKLMGMPKKKALLILGGLAVGVILGGLIWVAIIAVQSLSGGDEAGPAPAPAPATDTKTNAVAKTDTKTTTDGAKPATDGTKPAADTAKTGSVAAIAPPPIAPATNAAPPKKEVIQWPILVVKGLLGTGSGGGAIINNEIVGVGQEIQGVKLVSVNANDTVTLSYKGQSRTLRNGDITN